MPTIIVHQEKEYSQDLNFNIPLEWIVHNTPYIYVDRIVWPKSMNQLSTVFSASIFDNQIIFFDGHDSHFYERILSYMDCQRTGTPPYDTSGNDHG